MSSYKSDVITEAITRHRLKAYVLHIQSAHKRDLDYDHLTDHIEGVVTDESLAFKWASKGEQYVYDPIILNNPKLIESLRELK